MCALPMATSVCLSPGYQLHHGWVCLLGLYKESGTRVYFGDSSPVMGRVAEKPADFLTAMSPASGASGKKTRDNDFKPYARDSIP